MKKKRKTVNFKVAKPPEFVGENTGGKEKFDIPLVLRGSGVLRVQRVEIS